MVWTGNCTQTSLMCWQNCYMICTLSLCIKKENATPAVLSGIVCGRIRNIDKLRLSLCVWLVLCNVGIVYPICISEFNLISRLFAFLLLSLKKLQGLKRRTLSSFLSYRLRIIDGIFLYSIVICIEIYIFHRIWLSSSTYLCWLI